MTEFVFEPVSTDNIRLLNHFLKQHKEQSANRADWNFWLKQGGKVIATARVISVEAEAMEALWLRGLFVVKSHRKLGLGQKLMLQIHKYLQQTLSIKSTAYSFCIYAFPHGHLHNFYSQLDYQTCEPDKLPEALKTRYLNAKKVNKDWLCMVYVY